MSAYSVFTALAQPAGQRLTRHPLHTTTHNNLAGVPFERLGFDEQVTGWKVERLSSNERQRLAVLRLLENRPRVVLLDEPILIQVFFNSGLAYLLNRTRGWYEARDGVVPHEQCCPADLHEHGGH